nr:hypothetical protein [Tanacetum cinerariifolium]
MYLKYDLENNKGSKRLKVLFTYRKRYDGDECVKGIMPTKIELTLEQSQQGVSNDVLVLSYDESKSRRVSERAFMTLFGQDNETFTSTIGTKPDEHITSSSSGSYITHVVNADIRPANDQVPSVEVDSNTTPDSKNMYHRGEEIDQDIEQDQVKSSLLKAEFLKKNDMVKKKWKPTGRIFKTAGLKCIPTGKMFTDCITKVDSEPLNGSNDAITNLYECDPTLNVSACTLNQSLALHRQMAHVQIGTGPDPQRKESSGLVPQPPSPTPNVPPIKNDLDTLFCPTFDEYFNPSPSVAQPILVAAVQEPVVLTSTPLSTRIDQDTPSTSTSQTIKEAQSHVIPTSVEEDDHGIEVAHIDNDL